MIVIPTYLTAAPTSVAFLESVRAAAPALAPPPDDTLLHLGARVATLAYGGAHAEVWRLARDLEVSEDAFDVVVREALTTLYPVSLVAETVGAPALPA